MFSAISCANNGENIIQNTTADKPTPEKTTATQELPAPEPTEFYAGYSRVDISPEKFPVPNDNGNATSVLNPLYATVVAVSDGESNALFITLDTIFVNGEVLERTLSVVKKYK